VRGLAWQPMTLPFTAGLNQKADPRALQPPELSVCTDAQFDEIGGIQTRLPYAALGSDLASGGTVSNARRLIPNGNELLLFTRDTLYSWNASLSKWVSKGTHLAVKIEEESKFITTGDQIDGDRAELNGVAVYAWVDGTTTYVSAIDKSTGAVMIAPSLALTGSIRPRLVALATKILLFSAETAAAALVVRSIDPANFASGGASAPVDVVSAASATFNSYYDVVRNGTADQAIVVSRHTPTTSYDIATVTAGLTVVLTTKARTCDGPIAVSVPPTGATMQVIRGNGANVQGDYITTSGFVDVTTGQAIGTVLSGALNQIAACHRSIADSGAYRCYVFWSANENSDASEWLCKSNYVDTAGTIGTQGTFVRRLGVASRAFDHNGRVYFWGVFANASGAGYRLFRSQLQNGYFLYRDDGFLVAKAVTQRAGGFAPSVGRLPGVALTDGTTTYSWCATERRVIPLGAEGSGYADRGPRDVVFTFDSNEARRCARLGQTLYITGGEILQYDGHQLTEVGYHVYPWTFAFGASGAGNLEDGLYAWKVTWRWDNAVGDVDRSTTATTDTDTIAGGPDEVTVTTWTPLHITHKTSRPIAVEVWRTLKNPVADSPFYLVTSKDPAATGDNGYVSNDPTANLLATFSDNYADADADAKETSPENGDVLENLSPPPATVIAASDTRLFLAGVAGDPHRVWYSKLRGDGEVAAFHDALTVPVPAAGGAITALSFLQETLVVFRETAIYALPGDGFDNTANGQNYGPARSISTDIGAVNAESVAVTDRGIIFKSSKGWYVLTKGWSLEYIGGAVSDYDDETPLAIDVIESQHQVRVLTAARMLVFDTLIGQWPEWSISDGVHACTWQGTHTYLTTTGPKTQQTTFASATYGIDVELAWVKLGDLQGYGCVDRIDLLGEFRSSCTVRVRLARDFWKDGVDTYFQDKSWNPYPGVVGGPLQVKHGPSIRQMQAIKIRITVTPSTAGESVKLTGLSLVLGFDPRRASQLASLPVNQRQ